MSLKFGLFGIINTVFKNKGNANEPKNSRAITLMSCFGKVFTGILNSRLTLYAEETEQNFRYCLASGVMEKNIRKKTINGKCFNTILNLYQNVKNGVKSDFFCL